MSILNTKERVTEANILANAFRRNRKHENIEALFVKREADDEFAEIGKARVGKNRAAKLDDHILVWTGYEVVTKSKYLV